MRKLTSCCIATMAVLALTLSAHASPGSAVAGAAGLYSALGVGPVILVADDDNDKKNADSDKKKEAPPKKAPKSKEQNVKQQIQKNVPAEYQQYLPSGMGGGGGGN
jgi:hypothetical protein